MKDLFSNLIDNFKGRYIYIKNMNINSRESNRSIINLQPQIYNP